MNYDPYSVDVKPKKRSAGTKIALGCGCGCLVIFILIIAVIVGLLVWFLGRSPLPDEKVLMRSDVDNYIVVRLAPDNQGLLELFNKLRELNFNVDDQLAEDSPLKRLLELSRNSPGMKSQDMEAFLPIQAVLSNSCNEMVWSNECAFFSFSRFIKPLGAVFKLVAKQKGVSGFAKSIKEEGMWTVFEIDPQVWLGLAKNHILFSGNSARLSQVAKDLGGNLESGDLNATMTPLLENIPKDAMAYGLHTDHGGNIKVIFDKLLETTKAKESQQMSEEEYQLVKTVGLPLITQNLTDIVWYLRFMRSDITKIDLNLGCKEAMFCEQIQLMLMLQKPELEKQLPPEIKLTDYSVKTEGSRILLAMEMSGMVDFVTKTMKQMEEQQKQQRQ